MKKLIKLYQPKCNPCDQVDLFLKSQGTIYESFNVQENPEKASEYGVMGVPATILIDEEGVELQRSIGFKPPELEDMISKL